MKSITQKIIESIKGKQNTIEGEMCGMCGGSSTVEEWYETKDVLSGNFTDFSFFQKKDSTKLCSFCGDCLSDNLLPSPKGKTCGLRYYSWLVENGRFKTIDMNEKKYYLFEYKFQPPFILAFTETGKKHISFKARESYDPNVFYVCLDTGNVFFEREKWREIYLIVQEYYNAGATREELLRCEIKPWKFEKYELAYFKLIRLKKYKNTDQYKLIINSLGPREKNNNPEEGLFND